MTSLTDLQLTNSIAARSDRLSHLDPRIASVLPAGGTFVDLGCGDGLVLDEVAPLVAQAKGIDFYSVRLESRGRRPLGWEYVTANLNERIPLGDESVDAAYSNQVIEHLADPVTYGSELFRVLRKGGRAVVTTPNVRYVRHLFNLAVLGRGPRTANNDTTDGSWDDGHIHYFTHNDLREVFKGLGFSLIHSQALINVAGRMQSVRRLFDALAHTPPVREFLSNGSLTTKTTCLM
jgi:ubiquinone/menaquinone biosynthesis C-methylase UbiE